MVDTLGHPEREERKKIVKESENKWNNWWRENKQRGGVGSIHLFGCINNIPLCNIICFLINKNVIDLMVWNVEDEEFYKFFKTYS